MALLATRPLAAVAPCGEKIFFALLTRLWKHTSTTYTFLHVSFCTQDFFSHANIVSQWNFPTTVAQISKNPISVHDVRPSHHAFGRRCGVWTWKKQTHLIPLLNVPPAFCAARLRLTTLRNFWILFVWTGVVGKGPVWRCRIETLHQFLPFRFHLVRKGSSLAFWLKRPKSCLQQKNASETRKKWKHGAGPKSRMKEHNRVMWMLEPVATAKHACGSRMHCFTHERACVIGRQARLFYINVATPIVMHRYPCHVHLECVQVNA